MKHNGHHEEIQQKIFWNVSVVKSEEDYSKAQSNKLINRITEWGAEEFHPSNCYQDNITAVKRQKEKPNQVKVIKH